MPTTLEQYRAAKADYLKYRNQARKELIARFNELANELLRIQQELLDDFGEKIAMPSKARKNKPSKPSTGSSKGVTEASASPSPKVVAIQKRLATQKKRFEELKAEGKPTKAAEDRIYELEDELRLAKE
jgi:hypothetical protein